MMDAMFHPSYACSIYLFSYYVLSQVAAGTGMQHDISYILGLLYVISVCWK